MIINLNVYHILVVNFLKEPENVTTVIMGQAYFPCEYNGTNRVPQWRIVDNNGVARQYSTTTLPPSHFFDGNGLNITRITQSQNLTTYSCFFELNRAGFYEIVSSTGTLFILTPVVFELQSRGGQTQPTGLIFEGGMIDESYIVIHKSGYTNLTFVVSLKINGSSNGKTFSMSFIH